MTISQFLNTRKSYGYKPVLSLVPRLSTWRYPQSQLGRGQLSIDSRRKQLLIDICCPRPSSAVNQLHVAAAVDGHERQTDGQTDTRPLHRRLLHAVRAASKKRTCVSFCVSVFMFLICGRSIQQNWTKFGMRHPLRSGWSRGGFSEAPRDAASAVGP